MRLIKVEEAVGLPIAHDITRVIPGVFKGAAYKKGHIIREEDIEELKKLGKEHIDVDVIPEGCIHENDAAERIALAIADSEEFEFTPVSEGKINIISKKTGLLKINKDMLYKLNSIEHIAISTRYDDIVIRKGEVVASERIVPLYTKDSNIKKVEKICSDCKLFYVKEFIPQSVHLIITGNEVYKGLIEDKFFPVLQPKISSYGSHVDKVTKVPDDLEIIRASIEESYKEGADIIICTGGMSVDEDDLTPIAIKAEVDELIVHGIPVQPGNMFLLGYKGNTAITGVPGSVMFFPTTVFDMAFSKLACREKISKEYFIKLGLGGLCYFCKNCTYPNCTFLKGR